MFTAVSVSPHDDIGEHVLHIHTLTQLHLIEYHATLCVLLTLNNLTYIVNNHQHERLRLNFWDSSKM